HSFQAEDSRFDRNVNYSNANSYTVDTNWYTDTGATDHITSDLDKLTVREQYNGRDQVHTANGAGMVIKHIGHSSITTPSKYLSLNDVLHVPRATKNLLYVHRLTCDNDVFLEYHPFDFFVKDRITWRTLLHGTCRGGLYPLAPSSLSSLTTSAHAVVSPPNYDKWHRRLGHPSSVIVRRMLCS